MSVLGLIMSFSPNLRSAMVRFPFVHKSFKKNKVDSGVTYVTEEVYISICP